MILPTPHGDKLTALLANPKLPEADRPRVEATVGRYGEWLRQMGALPDDENSIEELVGLLNDYKEAVDIDLIFDSPEDFLYRQKGQLKLDNTVIEEFLPWLFLKALPGAWGEGDLHLGPRECFSHLRFESTIRVPAPGGGLDLRTKDQDFAISRPLYLRASHRHDFAGSRETQTHIAYVAAEVKTNLDKTMFQEAAATAHDLKLAVPSSRYFLLCEWLDMTPISSSITAIEKVIVLRRAKRLASNVRKDFSTVAGRRGAREGYVDYLRAHPYAVGSFELFVNEVRDLIGDGDEEDAVVLGRGWF